MAKKNIVARRMVRQEADAPRIKNTVLKRGTTPAPLGKDSRVVERGGKRQGTITEYGPEVSGVAFDNGTFRYVNNDHLVNKGLRHG